MRLRWIVSALLVLLLCAGAAVPFWLVSNGVDEYSGDARYVARQAYRAAWEWNDNPIGRALTPAARVQKVWRDPGHCIGQPGAHTPYADWRAEVRYVTYFGIPAGKINVTCGGWAYGG